MGQAAKQAGVSKTSLGRWISKGRISAEKQEDGSYLIDASELDRILSQKERGNARKGNRDRNRNPQELRNETPKSNGVTPESDGGLQAEVVILREKVKLREEKISEQKEQIAELRTDRDDWKKQAQQLALTYQPAATQQPVERETAATGAGTSQTRRWAELALFAIVAGLAIGAVAFFAKFG